MTWINDRMNERAVEARRRNYIADAAENTFNGLWEEVIRCVQEAQSHGIQVGTNGYAYERIVYLSSPPTASQAITRRKELRVTLKKDKYLIAISGGIESPFDLVFDLRRDDVVCLKRDGIEVDLESAAQVILDPFLFPDLPALPLKQTKLRQIS
jgi:hypothetical protein